MLTHPALVCLQTCQTTAVLGAVEEAGAVGSRQHKTHHTELAEKGQDAHQGTKRHVFTTCLFLFAVGLSEAYFICPLLELHKHQTHALFLPFLLAVLLSPLPSLSGILLSNRSIRVVQGLPEEIAPETERRKNPFTNESTKWNIWDLWWLIFRYVKRDNWMFSLLNANSSSMVH